LAHAQGQHDALLRERKSIETAIEKTTYRLENGVLPAQALLKRIAQETQSKIKIHMENIVQLALDAIWEDKYEFQIIFEPKRSGTEARIVLIDDNEEMDPYQDDAGGCVDIVALTLRISAYTLSKTRNFIMMDEPMRFVSRDLQQAAAEIISELSKKLSIQFLINTHSNEIESVADRIFHVTLKKKVSIVETQ
jgi:DNA repair exonuclease SbcCD ATPase subunit